MQYIIAIALLVTPLSLTAGEAEPMVPDRFIGTWAGSNSSCGSDSDDLRLHIGSRRIVYWESEGPILAVVVRGREIALIAELSGEGHTWLATAKFTISAHGGMLVDRTSGPGKQVVRYRCPGPAREQRPLKRHIPSS